MISIAAELATTRHRLSSIRRERRITTLESSSLHELQDLRGSCSLWNRRVGPPLRLARMRKQTMSEVWNILKSAVRGYIANEALTRGAAISFYAVTSLTPVLLIVVAVAGIAFGSDLVRDSLITYGRSRV